MIIVESKDLDYLGVNQQVYKLKKRLNHKLESTYAIKLAVLHIFALLNSILVNEYSTVNIEVQAISKLSYPQQYNS